MKTIAFLSQMDEYSVGDFIQKFEDAKDMGEDEIRLRVNTPGGLVNMGWSWLMTIRDFLSENVTRKIHYRAEGMVASMGAFALLYIDNPEAIEQTKFTFHMAAYPSWMSVTESMQKELNDINSDLKSALEAKVDKNKWKEITGTSINDLFDQKKGRIDVTINAKQAKKLGIIKKVLSLSPIEASRLNSELIAARLEPIEIEPEAEIEIEKIVEKEQEMTAQEIKSKYPEVYNEIFSLGETNGEKKERDRVEAWMAFKEIDANKVHEGIEAGHGLTQKDMASFSAAAIKSGYVAQAQASAAEGSDTTPDEGSEDSVSGEDEASQKIQAFEAALDKIEGKK